MSNPLPAMRFSGWRPRMLSVSLSATYVIMARSRLRIVGAGSRLTMVESRNGRGSKNGRTLGLCFLRRDGLLVRVRRGFPVRKRPPKSAETKRAPAAVAGLALQSIAYSVVWMGRADYKNRGFRVASGPTSRSDCAR